MRTGKAFHVPFCASASKAWTGRLIRETGKMPFAALVTGTASLTATR